jgi:dTDP-N-acetylfucosamine:lipid II N-acetylfucosaminyltransferase
LGEFQLREFEYGIQAPQKMRLHLAVNDRFVQHFIEMTIQLNLQNDNRFVIYGDAEIPFNKTFDPVHVRFVASLEDRLEGIRDLVDQADVIYIHYLSEAAVQFLVRSKIDTKKLVWIFWGADGFTLPGIYAKVVNLNPRTVRSRIGQSIYSFFVSRNRIRNKGRIIRKIDYFAHYIPDDFTLFKNQFRSRMQFLDFSYGVTNQMEERVCHGDDVLIGNSASEANNHIYVLTNLIPKSVANKLIVPLSYGGSRAYTAEVKRLGAAMFPEKFFPLDSIMTSESYLNVLEKTGYAIMFHSRAQAWGTIIQLFWQGSKVFMYEKNNLFRFLRTNNFHVFSLNTKITPEDMKPLTKVEIERNRALLLKLFGIEAAREKYYNLLTISCR